MSESTTIEAPVNSAKPDKPKPKRQPPYVVIIENDDYHTFDYVFELLQKVFNKNKHEANILTMGIHKEGRQQVWTGTKELAELKVEQVKNFGDDTYVRPTVKFALTCYMEPIA